LKQLITVLSFFLRQKGEISENSLDNIIFNVVKEFSASDKNKENSFVISNEDLFTNVKIACNGKDSKTGSLFIYKYISSLYKRQF